MRRFYQDSWQGIPFAAFSSLSFFHLPGPAFYDAFYGELRRRCRSWDDLPAPWRDAKRMDAMLLADRLRRRAPSGEAGPLRALSVGCGLGYMEKILLDIVPDIELHVTETGAVCLAWLGDVLPAERMHVGDVPECLPPDARYGMIYLSTVDYGIPTEAMVGLLRDLRGRLAPGGELVCLSASLLTEAGAADRIAGFARNVAAGVMHCLGLRRRQFWGWRRTAGEYAELLRRAGFGELEEGRLAGGRDRYWIRGV